MSESGAAEPSRPWASDVQAAIYEGRAALYDALVSAEDCEQHLGPTLAAIMPLEGARVIEVGAGTGRLTRILGGLGAQVLATERAAGMLAVARQRTVDVDFVQADARQLPAADDGFELGIAGWVFGHFRHWMPDGWRDEIGAALAELTRCVRPGGVVVVIETLGTCVTRPAPPNAALGEYYAWLEAGGFVRQTLRTDYRFASVAEAERLCGAFFGARTAARIRSIDSLRVREFTGVWARRVLG